MTCRGGVGETPGKSRVCSLLLGVSVYAAYTEFETYITSVRLLIKKDRHYVPV